LKICHIISFIITSCDRPFNFKRDKTLIEEYQYTQQSEVIMIYYNVTKSEDKKNISLAIKNISGNFLVDLTIFIHIDKPMRITKYINLGNLKIEAPNMLVLMFQLIQSRYLLTMSIRQ